VGTRPFLIAVTDVLRRPGTRRPVHRAARFDDLAISTASVTAGQEVVADLVLESLSDGIVATGSVSVPWTGACRRCLDPVRETTIAEVREIFVRRPVEGETYPLVGDLIDLESMVHDAVLLALPLAPLCTAGCRGPEPEHFPTVVVTDDVPAPAIEPADEERPADPRWAALDQLKFD
jgi:uncharacterized protein